MVGASTVQFLTGVRGSQPGQERRKCRRVRGREGGIERMVLSKTGADDFCGRSGSPGCAADEMEKGLRCRVRDGSSLLRGKEDLEVIFTEGGGIRTSGKKQR